MTDTRWLHKWKGYSDHILENQHALSYIYSYDLSISLHLDVWGSTMFFIWIPIFNRPFQWISNRLHRIVDRSLLQGESIEPFRAAIRNPATRDSFERSLVRFLKSVKMAPDDFVAKAKSQPSRIEKTMISFISKREGWKKTDNCSYASKRPKTSQNTIGDEWRHLHKLEED